ncbi:MAG: hypothetical protein AAGF94_18700, partial [Pseudomonadota bacterium]
MAYKANFDLFSFENKVRYRFTDGFDQKQYQIAVGSIARELRQILLPGQNAPVQDEVFPEWLESVRNYLGVYDLSRFEKIKAFKSAIDTMTREDKRTDSMHFALPIHYRLHMPVEPNSDILRDKLDRSVFDGKTFMEAFGSPVFEIDPDVYDEPPPMAAPMSHPGYLTAMQVRERLEQDADDSIWLNPHNHYTLPLQQRKIEKGRLTSFVESKGMFRVLPVIAPSGAGKTRLVSEWMRDYSPKTNPESIWEAGFLSTDQDDQARNPVPWQTWKIKKNTLIVIDYTYAFDAVLKAVANSAINRASGREFKVRLIVIDHVMPKVLQEDFFWHQVASSKRIADQFQTGYLAPELTLKASGNKSEMLCKIIETSALVGTSNREDISHQVQDAVAHL